MNLAKLHQERMMRQQKTLQNIPKPVIILSDEIFIDMLFNEQNKERIRLLAVSKTNYFKTRYNTKEETYHKVLEETYHKTLDEHYNSAYIRLSQHVINLLHSEINETLYSLDNLDCSVYNEIDATYLYQTYIESLTNIGR